MMMELIEIVRKLRGKSDGGDEDPKSDDSETFFSIGWGRCAL